MKLKELLGLKTAVLAAACSIAWTHAAEAQFTQFTPPGTFIGRTISRSETVERAMQDARWKLGRVYFDPWAAIRNLSYTDTTERGESQLTVTVGAGVRGYTPLGSEMTLALHVLPEYVWWQDESERNRWNGRYGLGLFGDLGRTGMELSATRQDDAVFFSQELEEKVNTRLDEAEAVFDIEVGGGFSLVLGGTLRAIRYQDSPEGFVDLSVVDRDEQFYRLLVDIPLPRGFKLGVGAEASQADFDPGSSDRSNSGTSPVLTADYETPSFFFRASLLYLDLAPDGADSRFVDYSGLAGSAELSWRAWNRLEPQIYARNNLVYSFTDVWAYFDSPTAGLALRIAMTRSAWLRAYGETGVNDYTPFELSDVDRRDDFNTYGADIGFIFGKARFSVGAWTTDYDSNIPVFDRTTNGFRANFGISTGGGPWG
jgi:hypothetical protein